VLLAPVHQYAKLQHEVFCSPEEPGVWTVEAINWDGEGEIYWANFLGLDAEIRAREYADWLNERAQRFR
jgi:hypothetical protein